ncbi:SusC/RagA family TonB-linked outer membrane protein [Gallalistipes aquisgranensis]|uniref:SusC/RagA family TonB-linked outer membrane protein n=1 Tax=Gallalistipes aquisgranensis TaxID=2779358 RepID=UPI001CF80800|nr:TonB-dependent receptor [Gallalistipes aquisgranensis]MBE5032567.1 TonB-dependent receptor [Gallalistipes aquisgranensis]
MAKNYLQKSLLMLSVLLISTAAAYAQKITVRGVVSDEQGPLIGVSVVVKSSASSSPTGTATGIDGSYSISVPNAESVLVFSYVGYKTIEIKVGKQTSINVKMEADAAKLDEVVVVGYGVQKKSHLTGSVAKIDGGILADRPVSDVTTALQGQIPGLTINNTTSEVGVTPSIRVRGTGSISAGSSPLVIIDGYPVPDGLQTLNLSDIQSIEVLKDAASAAIYGSRAANGVIMVTTKSGASDKSRYSVKLYQGVKWAYKLHDMLSATEYLQWQEKEAAWGGPAVKTQDKVAAWLEQNMGSTDWQREGLRDAASVTNVQFSMQGGKRGVRYYSSAAWTRDQGIMLQNEVQKVTFRTKVDADLSKTVTFGVNVSANYQKAERPRNNFIDFYRTPSFLPVYHNAWSTALTGYTGFARGSHFNNLYAPVGDPDEYGNPTYNTTPVSPFNSANNNPRSVMANTTRWSENFQGMANVYLTVDICKGLQFKTSNGVNARYRPQYSYANKNALKDGTASEATFNSMLYVDLLTENTLTYNRKVGRHEFDILAGYTAESTRVQNVALTGTGFPTDNIQTLNAATIFELASENNGNGEGTGTFRYPNQVLESYLGRVSYSYDDRYLISASLRLDRSSLFTSGNRNAWFPSVSVGWRISEERFMKSQRVFSNLKLRASYGVTGNNSIDYNAALEVLNPANYPTGAGNGSLTPGAANISTTLANSNITWEQTDEYNFGLDAGFVDNKISLSVDGYYSVTRALLFEQPTQSFTGFQSYWNNIGKVRNAGVEIQLDTRQINHKKFKWSTNFNFSLSRNKLLEIGGEKQVITQGERSESYIARVGEPLIQYYGFKTVGVWNNQAEIDANPHFAGDVPGGLRIWDADGNGELNDNDRVALGSPYPDFTWGMTNNFSIGNFDVSFLLQGVQGVTVFNGDVFYNESHKYNRAYMENRWVSDTHRGDGKTPYAKTGYDIMLTDLGLQNASYLCLRDLTVGYTLPKKTARKIGLNGLRLYVTGSNLFYLWSDDYKGINPESRMTSGDYASPLIDGYQRGGFPLTSTFTFGIDLNF